MNAFGSNQMIYLGFSGLQFTATFEHIFSAEHIDSPCRVISPLGGSGLDLGNGHALKLSNSFLSAAALSPQSTQRCVAAFFKLAATAATSAS